MGHAALVRSLHLAGDCVRSKLQRTISHKLSVFLTHYTCPQILHRWKLRQKFDGFLSLLSIQEKVIHAYIWKQKYIMSFLALCNICIGQVGRKLLIFHRKVSRAWAFHRHSVLACPNILIRASLFIFPLFKMLVPCNKKQKSTNLGFFSETLIIKEISWEKCKMLRSLCMRYWAVIKKVNCTEVFMLQKWDRSKNVS